MPVGAPWKASAEPFAGLLQPSRASARRCGDVAQRDHHPVGVADSGTVGVGLEQHVLPSRADRTSTVHGS